MLVQRVTSFESIVSGLVQWNRLAAGIPFRKWEWLEPWWRQFQGRRELYVLQVTDRSGEIVGIAPWYLEPQAISGRTLQSLASGEVCSDYLGVLAHPECQATVFEALATWLVGANRPGSPDEWDVLQWDGQEATDPAVNGLLACLQRSGCTVHRQSGMNCWRIPLPATWEDYLANLPKPQRKRMRQARQTLSAGGEFRVHCATNATEWEQVWPKFVDLHQQRRISLGQPGCFGNATFHAFLEDSLRQMLQQGNAQLVLVERREQPVAALLLLTGGDTLYGYQMGTNPDCLADSPGWLVVCATVMTGIDQGYKALDLLRGDEPYKSRMGGQPREMLQIRVIPEQLGARLRHTAWLTGTTVKSLIKSGLNATGLTSPPLHSR